MRISAAAALFLSASLTCPAQLPSDSAQLSPQTQQQVADTTLSTYTMPNGKIEQFLIVGKS
jgi:hypothetical protein